MDRSRGSRPALRAPARLRSLRGLRPPRASLRCAGSRAPQGGLRPGAPAPIRGPPVPLAPGRCAPSAQWLCAPAPSGGFLRTSRPPLRRGPYPCAGPLRRGAPGPCAPPARPPGSPARPLVRRCAAPRALAGPVCLCRPIRSGAGSLFGRPSFAPGRLSAARGPAGSPLGRPRCGFGPGGLHARGLRRPGRRSGGRWPRAFCCSRAPAPAALSVSFCVPLFCPLLGFRRASFSGGAADLNRSRFAPWRFKALLASGRRTVGSPRRGLLHDPVSFSPAPLPSPPPPLGAPGKREAYGRGCGPAASLLPGDGCPPVMPSAFL